MSNEEVRSNAFLVAEKTTNDNFTFKITAYNYDPRYYEHDLVWLLAEFFVLVNPLAGQLGRIFFDINARVRHYIAFQITHGKPFFFYFFFGLFRDADLSGYLPDNIFRSAWTQLLDKIMQYLVFCVQICVQNIKIKNHKTT